jgi:hypothetical protein
MASDDSAPPPEVNISSQFEKEKDDPAMIAYMKSLGIDPDYKGPAVRSLFFLIFSSFFSFFPPPLFSSPVLS